MKAKRAPACSLVFSLKTKSNILWYNVLRTLYRDLNAYTITPLCGYGIMVLRALYRDLNAYTMTPLCGYGIMVLRTLYILQHIPQRRAAPMEHTAIEKELDKQALCDLRI